MERPARADLKEGDVLAGSTGLAVTPLAGEVRLEIASGAVVDATEGREVPGGTVLDANHLYIVAEGSSASFVVDSPTAVLSYQGGGALSLSYGAPGLLRHRPGPAAAGSLPGHRLRHRGGL